SLRSRGAHPGFPGQSTGGRDRNGCAPRRAQSQHRNRAAALPPGAYGGALRALAGSARTRPARAAPDADEIRSDARPGRDGGGGAPGDARSARAPGGHPHPGPVPAAFAEAFADCALRDAARIRGIAHRRAGNGIRACRVRPAGAQLVPRGRSDKRTKWPQMNADKTKNTLRGLLIRVHLRSSAAIHSSLRFYSFRNATSGSTRIARSAGIAHASMAVANRTPATAAYVAGSVGFTSKSCEARYRPVPSAAATPMASPAAINTPA